MHIQVDKKILESILSLCAAYTDKKDASSIASHFHISTQDDGLRIKANDYEIGIDYFLQKKVEILEEGKACVNAKKLIERLKPLRPGLLNLEVKDNFFFIYQGKIKYKLATFDDADFPLIPESDNKNKFDINSDELNASLTKITSPIDINHQRFALRGAFLDIKRDYINFVSTDTQRLAIYSLEKSCDEEFSLCIPKKAILAMKELFFSDKKVDIFYDKECLIAQNDKFRFFTKLINDNFPDYERIIPKNPKLSFTFNTQDFKDYLKTILPTGDQIRLGFFKDRLSFESKDSTESAKAEYEISLPVEDSFYIAFKIKFMMDFLNCIESETFSMQITEPELAFLVSSGKLRTIIAPVII